MKPTAIALIIVSAILIIALILGTLSGTAYREEITELTDLNTYFEEQALTSDFAYTAASMEIDNLEQVIASKDELIRELMVKEEVLELYKNTMGYTLTWVYYAEELMTINGIPYFEYIGEQVLSEVYFEELQDQYEFFEGLEE